MQFQKIDLKRSIYTFIQNNLSKIYYLKIKKIEKIALIDIDKFHLKVLKQELKQNSKLINFYSRNEYQKAIESDTLEEFLRNIPVMEKKDLIENQIFDANWAKNKRRHTSSGTSGTPLIIYNSLNERLFTEALIQGNVLKIINHWGFKNTLFLSGFYVNKNFDINKYYSYDPLNSNIYASIYHLTADKIDDYKNLFDKFSPKIIYGYASTVNQLAVLMRNQGITSVDLVITTSEILTDEFRNNIFETFDCLISDMYGSQEGGHFAMECKYGVKHIHPARGIIEVKTESGKISRVGTGETIVTPIFRNSFPLYRYNLKDYITIYKPLQKCKCGLHTYAIGLIDGRSEDLVRTRDGRKIGYLNFHATKNLKNIIVESQLIQKNFDSFIFNCVLQNHISKNEIQLISNQVKTSLEQRLGYPISFDLKIVESIEKGARGKFKAVLVEKF